MTRAQRIAVACWRRRNPGPHGLSLLEIAERDNLRWGKAKMEADLQAMLHGSGESNRALPLVPAPQPIKGCTCPDDRHWYTDRSVCGETWCSLCCCPVPLSRLRRRWLADMAQSGGFLGYP